MNLGHVGSLIFTLAVGYVLARFFPQIGDAVGLPG